MTIDITLKVDGVTRHNKNQCLNCFISCNVLIKNYYNYFCSHFIFVKKNRGEEMMLNLFTSKSIFLALFESLGRRGRESFGRLEI